jgi:hypothetical protein
VPELTINCNGQKVTRVVVHVPQAGVWWTDVDFDVALPATNLAGAAQVVVGPLSLSGTFAPARTGTFFQQSKARVLGGAGAWGKAVRAKSYHDDGAGVKATTVIQDLAREVGERVGTIVPSRARLGVDWDRRASVASEALSLVLGSTPWWVDYAGLTQVGPRPESEIGTDYEVLTFDPRFGIATVTTETPQAITIGSVLRRKLNEPRIVREITIDVTSTAVRLQCWCPDVVPARNRLLDLVAAAVRAVAPELPYTKLYRYRVVEPNLGDHRWKLQPVKKAIGIEDISPADMRPGMAGLVAELMPGSEVLVGFIEADPGQPFILAHSPPDSPGWLPLSLTMAALLEIKVGELAVQPAARLGDAVQAGPFGGVITAGSAKVRIE